MTQLPDPISIEAADLGVDPDKLAEVKQEILATNLLSKGDALATVLQSIVDEPLPTKMTTQVFPVFTQARDAAGADMLIVVGNQQSVFEGKFVTTDKGVSIPVVSVEYQSQPDWTLLRFPSGVLSVVGSVQVPVAG